MSNRALESRRDQGSRSRAAMVRESSYSGVRLNVLRIGSTVADKYVIRRVVQFGSSATVYEAEMREGGDRVAIKVSRAEAADRPALRERYEHEARICAAVQHPNLMTVHGAGALDDGSPFLVMELLEGEDLAQRIARGPLSVAAAVEIGKQLLSGVQALADQGIVHRDIKPHNVMLHRPKEGGLILVKLIDFGLAVGREDSGAQGNLTGTPHYMSPEQADGNALDTRSDIYSTGALLYEALTERTPFHEPTAPALVAAILRDPITSIQRFRTDCPEALEHVILRALARRPDARYATPSAMGNELTRLVHHFAWPTGDQALATQGPPTRRSRKRALTSQTTTSPLRRLAIPFAIALGLFAIWAAYVVAS